MIHRKETKHIYQPIEGNTDFQIEIDSDGAMYIWNCCDSSDRSLIDINDLNWNSPDDVKKIWAIADVINFHRETI
jgi:hypothetical protein